MSKAILGLFILIILLNSKELISNIILHQKQPSAMKLHNLGDHFLGLKEILKDQRRIGYITDKDIENSLVIAQFQQAQYHLAPSTLYLNQSEHPFVILDLSSPQVTIAKIHALGLKPLKASPTGLILAINPQIGKQK
jgi:hypothetical protein